MTRDEQIDALRQKIEQAAEEEQEQYPLDNPEVCCKSCYYGPEYGEFADAQERRVHWLCVLLEKRATPRDLRLARAIKMGAWP